jgi:hypothetical protein
VSQAVLDIDAFAEPVPTRGRSCEPTAGGSWTIAVVLLEMFVGRDPHLSSSVCARRALIAKVALATGVAWKANGQAQEDRRLLAGQDT